MRREVHRSCALSSALDLDLSFPDRPGRVDVQHCNLVALHVLELIVCLWKALGRAVAQQTEPSSTALALVALQLLLLLLLPLPHRCHLLLRAIPIPKKLLDWLNSPLTSEYNCRTLFQITQGNVKRVELLWNFMLSRKTLQCLADINAPIRCFCP